MTEARPLPLPPLASATRRRDAPARRWRPLALFAALAFGVSACVSPTPGKDGRYADPIGGAPVISNETPYSDALRCLGSYALTSGRGVPRVAVGRIADYTGKEEFDGGRKVTQGAALMAISALSKAGVRLVEHYDTSVSELELKYANNKLIGDQDQRFRKILAGSIPGSDYYLVGGITELNYNIRSAGIDGFGGEAPGDGIKGNIGAKLYVLDVGLDLRLVDTRTLEVIDVISYQKQILGRELRAGIFDFFSGYLVDVGVGERSLEPIQMAVRAVIERAALEMVSDLYGVGPEACAAYNAQDPLGPLPRDAHGLTVAQMDDARRDPYRWHKDHDTDVQAALRGSVD
jgi:curli production assembly/transport component CsgG/holdfast attachment protein HfaB